jgi:putative ABC transport system permease protein
MEVLWQDLRYAARVLRKSPGFTFFAVASLALGIAASTAIFSVADTILFRRLPYRDASRLVFVWEDASSFGFPHDTPAPGNFSDWKARNEVFEDMAAVSSGGSFNLMGSGNPEELLGKRVTANLFSVLGVAPVLGRNFRAEDDVPGAALTAILSHGLWLRRFGGDPKIVGSEIQLNYQKYTLIGVMPRGFHFPERESELWVPAQFAGEQLSNHGSHFLQVVARLRPGTSLQKANANLAAIADQLEKEHPDSNTKVGAFAVPLRKEFAGDVTPAILVLVASVCFVLLIACANVANLLLARATGRRREFATRVALGASSGRMIRQILTESILLSTLAGIAGFVLSLWATQFLESLIPAGISPQTGTQINVRMLLIAIGLSVTTGILFGIMPAMRISQLDLIAGLGRGGGRAGAGLDGRGARDLFVVSEVALAIIMLTGGALMIRSIANLYHLDPGFRADHVLVLRTPLPRQKYHAFATRAELYGQVLDRIGNLPGVVAAGYTTWVPLTNEGGATAITIEGRPEPAPGKLLIPNVRIISWNYIHALRMKLVEGRLLDERDGRDTQPVALVNETMAKKFWPGENPVGMRFKQGTYKSTSPWITVVGIVGDVHQAGLDKPARPEMYLPYQQQDFGFEPEYLAVRTSGEPMLAAEAVRKQVWAVDKDQAVAGMMPLEELVDDNLAQRRMQASLLGGFAGLALLLAALGIYAVLSFAVTQRTREIGVRVALGASAREISRMILVHGVKLFLAGAALGLTAAFALARLLVHMLYGVSASDPLSFAGVTVLLAGVAYLACYIPARRAVRVDPVVALRYE